MKLKLRDALESKQPTINEGILGKFLNLLWTVSGTKDGLFKAVQSKYGKDVNNATKEIEDANKALRALIDKLED